MPDRQIRTAWVHGKEHMNPFFSIVIPTYNRSAYLAECLACLRRQTFNDYEIIVVDNASTDDTGRTVAAAQDGRIQYIRHAENLGGFRNLLFAAGQGSGEFLIIHQDDDYLHADFLQRCHSCVDQDDGIVVYGTATWRGSADGGYKGDVERDLSGRRTDYPLLDKPLILDGRRMAAYYMVAHFINHPAIALRRSALAQVRGYCADPDCFADLVTIPAVMSVGRVAYDPRIGGLSRIHAGQLSNHMGKQQRATRATRTFRLQVETLERSVPGWEGILEEETARISIQKLFPILKDAVGFDAPPGLVKILWRKCVREIPGRGRLMRKLCSRIGFKNSIRLLRRVAV